MKNIFLLIPFLLWSAFATSSDLQFLFNNQLQNAEGRSVKELNGSFYFIGYADDSLGNTKTALTKLDKNGNLLWRKSYGDSTIHVSPFINVTVANELIVVGQKISGSNTDYEIMLLDTLGNVIWNRSYGTTSKNESLKYIEATADKGFIGCGFITQTNLLANDFLVVKFDSTGSIVWQKNYGGNRNDYAQMLRKTSQGHYIVSGDTHNGHDIDTYLLLIDSTGNEIWHRQVGDVYDNGNQTVIINHKGDFVLCGESTIAGSFEFDIYMAAFDSAGNFLWSKYIGGNGSDAGFAINENSTHDYFVTGYSSSPFSGAPYTAYLLKLDSAFHPQCLKYFLQPDLTICYDEIMLNDSSFALAGTSGSNFYFALVGDSGCSGNFIEHDLVSGTETVVAKPLVVNVFQNSNNQLEVIIPSAENTGINHFALFDVTGRLLLSQDFSVSLSVDLSAFENHFLVWQVGNERGQRKSGRFIKG